MLASSTKAMHAYPKQSEPTEWRAVARGNGQRIRPNLTMDEFWKDEGEPGAEGSGAAALTHEGSAEQPHSTGFRADRRLKHLAVNGYGLIRSRTFEFTESEPPWIANGER